MYYESYTREYRLSCIVFFTNAGSIAWCKQNYKIFGLDPRKDTIMFVDWNTGMNNE